MRDGTAARAIAVFSVPVRRWFAASFEAPTPVQVKGWPVIASGRHALLVAPTGTGKTLAAFLWAVDTLVRLPRDVPPGVRVLYVSPLRALVYDVERNLRSPRAGGSGGGLHGARPCAPPCGQPTAVRFGNPGELSASTSRPAAHVVGRCG